MLRISRLGSVIVLGLTLAFSGLAKDKKKTRKRLVIVMSAKV